MIVTDIHTHIIPDVDDGSRSEEESIAMLQMSAAQGVGTVIATPHSWGIDDCGFDYMLSRFEDLKRTVAERNIPVQLYLGCEMLVFSHTVDACIRKLNDGRYPTLAGSRYVLTEFYPDETPDDMVNCVERIATAGYVPAIAHAERYRKITLPDIRALKNLGAMIQINAYSIANEQNARTIQLANECLTKRMVDFIGSDAHRLDHRPPLIEDGINALVEHYSKDYAKRVIMLNPQFYFFGNS